MQLSPVTAQAPWDDAMGKRCLTLVLALLQVLSLSACTGRPDTTTPLSGIGEGKDGPSPQSAPFDAAYWTAVRHESYNPSFDRTEVSTMAYGKMVGGSLPQ